MLGSPGRFSTRSRRYSTTLSALRATRTDHAREQDVSTGRLLSLTKTPSGDLALSARRTRP